MSNHLRFPEMKKSLVPQELNPEHEYVIELRQMAVVGIGEHNYWVLRNKTTGLDIAEIHGAAFDKTMGKLKAVGLPGDSLGFLRRRTSDGPLFEDQVPGLVTKTLEISGPTGEIERRWNNGLASARHFNEKGIGYALLGGSPESRDANSNGAAYSIGRAMEVAPDVLENAPKGTWRLAPGWGRDLHQEYPEIPQPVPSHDKVRIEKLTPKQEPVPFPWEQGKISDDVGKDGGAEGRTRFIAGGTGDDVLVGNAGDDALRAEADRLIGSDDYWRNADKQARTRALFQEIERRERGDQDASEMPDFQNLPYFPDAEEKDSRRDLLDRGEPIEAIPLRFDAVTDDAFISPDALRAENLQAEARDLMAADDYWRDPHKQRRMAAIFKRLYPGTLRTAPLDFGEGA
jgi:hypothetical protein